MSDSILQTFSYYFSVRLKATLIVSNAESEFLLITLLTLFVTLCNLGELSLDCCRNDSGLMAIENTAIGCPFEVSMVGIKLANNSRLAETERMVLFRARYRRSQKRSAFMTNQIERR
jgi:hypothetical protein